VTQADRGCDFDFMLPETFDALAPEDPSMASAPRAGVR